MNKWQTLSYILIFIGITTSWFPELGVESNKSLIMSYIGFILWFIVDCVNEIKA